MHLSEYQVLEAPNEPRCPVCELARRAVRAATWPG